MPRAIRLSIPDWTDERHLYIMAGIELVAYKHHGKSWMIKTSRCNQCGNCCDGRFRYDSFFPNIKDGTCLHLKAEGDKRVCSLGVSRPFGCCVGIGTHVEGCTELFEELNVS